MKRLLFLLGALLISTFAFADAQILISSVPQPKEMIVAPHGYASCRMVPAGFQHGVWRDQHRVCQYTGGRARGTWISGYWTCSKFKHHHCAYWAWEPSRWEGRHGQFYGQPVPPPPPHYAHSGGKPHYYQ